MNRNPSTNLMFQPANMINSFSSMRFLHDTNFAGISTAENVDNFSGLQKPDILDSNEKITALEQENLLLERKLFLLSQENERINMHWEMERKIYEDKLANQNIIINSLTSCINKHLENEIASRENLIKSVADLKDKTNHMVHSQNMTRLSEEDTPSFDLLKGESSNKISKPKNKYISRDNSNSSLDSNKGKMASDLITQIVLQQQTVRASNTTTPLTINKKIIEKHKEELRSQSLPYNLSTFNPTSNDGFSGYVSGHEVLKNPLHNIPLDSSVEMQTTKSLDDGVDSFPLTKPLNDFNQLVENDNTIFTVVEDFKQKKQIDKEKCGAKQDAHKNSSEQIPVYQFMKCPKSVLDIWNEFTKSTPEKKSLLEMNSLYGSLWRKHSPALDKQYSRRNMIYKAIMFGMEEKKMPLQECIHVLEKARLKYYDSETGKELDGDEVSLAKSRNADIKIKQKSVGWLTNHANIPEILKT